MGTGFYFALVMLEPADAELRSWWESLSEQQKDLLREYSYSPSLPEAALRLLRTCPAWDGDRDGSWWPQQLRWLLHEDDPEFG